MIKLERKKKILESAEELFANNGFFSTSVADIIKHAKIARGTFYIYFDSKRSIFDALLDNLLDELNLSIERVDIFNNSYSLSDQLKRNIVRVLSLLNKRKRLAKILLTYASGVDVDLDKKIHIFYQKVLEMIRSAILLGIEMEIIRVCNTTIASHCVIGAIKELSSTFIFNDLSVNDIEELADEVIQFGLKGLFIN